MYHMQMICRLSRQKVRLRWASAVVHAMAALDIKATSCALQCHTCSAHACSIVPVHAEQTAAVARNAAAAAAHLLILEDSWFAHADAAQQHAAASYPRLYHAYLSLKHAPILPRARCLSLLCAAAHYLRRMALAINTAMNMSGGMAAAAAAAAAAGSAAGPAAQYGQVAAAAVGGLAGAAYDRQQQQQRGNKQHVADLLLVKARPVYGYYAEESLFVKVVL
jgi:hypothetical protein